MTLSRVARFIAALAFFAAGSCKQAEPPRITVAAAANLSQASQVLGQQFESQTGIHPVFSLASTTQLTTQIENSAPFDVFLSADAQHVDQLDQKGLLAPGTASVYAVGVLALWIPSSTPAVQRVEDLASPDVHVIAVAKPELAPYGQAAVDALHRAGIWDKVSSRIVYAENINQAKQFGTSHNADAVFTAYSLVLKESGRVIQVDQALYQPITQKLGIIAASTHKAAAQRFTDFLLHGKGQQVLISFGYHPPAG